MRGYAEIAIQRTIQAQYAYCKFLSANDTSETGGHQAGVLISIKAKDILFESELTEHIQKKTGITIYWNDNYITRDTVFTYYESKKELRITSFGRNFPYFNPLQTGSLFVLIKIDTHEYYSYFLETEEEIEAYLTAFNISTTGANTLIVNNKAVSSITLEAKERRVIDEFISALSVEFPASAEMSQMARTIQARVYDHLENIRIKPDAMLIDWTDIEFRIFKALEEHRYMPQIVGGFTQIDDFIKMANAVLNRRKSRAGKSLEHHLSALFEGNGLHFTSQAITEGNKKPDFIFPSESDYHNPSFSADRLIMLGAKTTCKDRWRQIINEADRLKGKTKYLATLQQGISSAQMDEMEAEGVVLVVPRQYISTYPPAKRDKIWTIKKFIGYVKEVEGL